MKHLFLFSLLFLVVACSGSNNKSKTSVYSYKDLFFTDFFKCTEGWIAGDGAYSIPVNDNKSLWTFGDSYIDSYDSETGAVPCLFQARTAAVLIDIMNPTVKSTIRNSSGEKTLFTYGNDRKFWFWPSAGFTDNDTVYVFLNRLRATGERGMWGFAGVDTGYVAKMHGTDFSAISYSILPGTDSINFGVSVIEQANYTLVYGIRDNGFGNDLFVARFKKGNLYGSWEYFDGEEWSSDIKEIKKIHSEFTASFYICKIKNTYALITTEFSVGCDQGKNIFAATSVNPWGPFAGQHSVWQVDDTLNGHFPFFYMANAHPEFDNGNEELLITYCINGYGTCVETCNDNKMDPDVYRPKAIRVPYSLILN